MPIQPHTPPTIAPPAALYSHGMEVPPHARWLFVSGQVGVHADGRVGRDAREQVEIIWRSIVAILASADMTVRDLVKVTTFATAPAQLPTLREVRDRVLAGHRPASTLVVVAALARPEWLVEIEAYAAKA